MSNSHPSSRRVAIIRSGRWQLPLKVTHALLQVIHQLPRLNQHRQEECLCRVRVGEVDCCLDVQTGLLEQRIERLLVFFAQRAAKLAELPLAFGKRLAEWQHGPAHVQSPSKRSNAASRGNATRRWR